MVHSTLIKTGVLVVAAREFSVSPINPIFIESSHMGHIEDGHFILQHMVA